MDERRIWRRFVTGVLPLRPGFDRRVVYTTFVVDVVALEPASALRTPAWGSVGNFKPEPFFFSDVMAVLDRRILLKFWNQRIPFMIVFSAYVCH